MSASQTEQIRRTYAGCRTGHNVVNPQTTAYERQRFDAWLDAIQADAWERGWKAGFDDATLPGPITDNPYLDEVTR